MKPPTTCLPQLCLCTTLLVSALSSCGSPSPWANWVGAQYKNLTKQSLRELGGSNEAFTPFAVGLIADPQGLPGYLRFVSARLNRRDDLAFTFILGDITDRSLRDEFLWVAGVVEDSDLPTLTVVGNHDGLLYGEKTYRNLFGDLNYSFIYRDVKFIVWNNNPYEWGYPDFKWLRAQVESFPYVFIFSHQPPGAIDRYAHANDELRDVYEHEHVLGSAHGHTHKYHFQYVHEKPVITVAIMKEEHHAIVHFGEDRALRFEKCWKDKCRWQE